MIPLLFFLSVNAVISVWSLLLRTVLNGMLNSDSESQASQQNLHFSSSNGRFPAPPVAREATRVSADESVSSVSLNFILSKRKEKGGE